MKYFAIILILACLFSTSYSQQENILYKKLPPDKQILNSDGKVNLMNGISGSVDLKGWQMVTEPDGSPKFIPSNQLNTTIDPDDNWFTLGSGLNGVVYAVAVIGTDLYVGGNFSTAGGVSASNIAKWDGTNWSALGTGTDGEVWVLAVMGTDLYAGGSFTTAGGVNANLVAKWDGTNWSALGSGVGGDFVAALAVIGTDVYAGGAFTTAGGVGVSNIAKWDGVNWSGLGSGVDNIVCALAVMGTDIYAGGEFTNAGGVSASHIAKWDGLNWSALGAGTDGDVYIISFMGSDLYTGGYFTTAGGVSSNNIAKWDGTNWSALGSGVDNIVMALTVMGTDIYAGGFFTNAGGVSANKTAKWDGTNWSPLGSGLGGNVYGPSLAVIGTDVYAGGAFTTAGGKSANRIAGWSSLGTISGQKFCDINRDGVKNTGESGLANWRIRLSKDNLPVDSALTDENGDYVFTDLTNGIYTTSEHQQTNWIQTFPLASIHTDTISTGGRYITGIDFGNDYILGQISGTVFNDTNRNSVQDLSEPGLPDWKLLLYKNGNLFDSILSLSDGSFSFNDLQTGSYVLKRVTQYGWHQTYPVSPDSYSVSITSVGELLEGLNFGIYNGDEFVRDGNTLMLLHFNDNLIGSEGETPEQVANVTFQPGIFGSGAYFPSGNVLKYASAGNIKATEGTLEFWMKPLWNGNDNNGYILMQFGGAGGMLFLKDGANNWRSIFNRFSDGGQPENGTIYNVSGKFYANNWYHCAFTWSNQCLKLYVNGSLKDSVRVTITLPQISDVSFRIGDDLWPGGAINAVIDELRISDIERTSAEIAASYNTTPILRQYRLFAYAGPHGSVSPSDTVVVNSGESQTFTFAPDFGYYADSVFINGEYRGRFNEYTFTNVGGDSTLYVTFSNLYDITATYGPHGYILPYGTVRVPYGTDTTFTFIPYTDFKVDSVYIDGLYDISKTNYTFTNVTGPHTIRVTFAIKNPIEDVWVEQTSGTTLSLWSVSIVDDQIAWVCGLGGAALRTTNGGSDWTLLTSLGGDAHNIYAIDDKIALVCVNPGGDDGRIYRTADGGTTWEQVYQNTGAGAFMNAVHMFDPMNGVAEGDPVGGQWVLIKTTDGGLTWSSLTSLPQVSYETSLYNSFEWVGSQNGWMGSTSKWIYRTTDGGVTWSSSPTKYYFNYSISFINDSIGMTSGSNRLHSTLNGGIVWDSVYNFPGISHMHVAGVDVPDEQWWMAKSNGILQLSTDRGLSWYSSHLVTGQYRNLRLKKVPAVESVIGYAVGDNGIITKFSQKYSYPIIANSSGNGTIVPSGTVNVLAGHDTTFTFIPDVNNKVDSVFIDGVYDTSKSSYTFHNVTEPHTITVSFKLNKINTTGMFRKGWNMVSLPVGFEDYQYRSIFPAAANPLYSYDGVYISKDTLDVGSGYWLLYPDADTIDYLGTLMITDTVTVKAGWNMIGSVSYPIWAASITVDPPELTTSQFFTYAGSYVVSDTIYPWAGYWVKSDQAGTLILSVDPGSEKANRINIVATNELPPSAPSERLGVGEIPSDFALDQNHPNPFNPVTRIKYQLPVESMVSIKVYNMLGQEVAALVDGIQDAGYKYVEWNANNYPSGMYVYRMSAEAKGKSVSFVKKLVLVK